MPLTARTAPGLRTEHTGWSGPTPLAVVADNHMEREMYILAERFPNHPP